MNNQEIRRRGADSNGQSNESERKPLTDKRKKKNKSFWSLWTLLITLVGLTVSIILFLGIICPVAFRSSMTIRKSLLFMNWLNLPLFRNLSNPETDFGLNCTRNLFIENSNQGLKLGAWHILPSNRISECNLNTVEKLSPEKAFADSNHVILYLHGNGGARGGNHRKELYKVLAYNDLLNYHVLTIDYRGYGDSTPIEPTSDGLVEDAKIAYEWLLGQLNGNTQRVTVWGHSLGTAVAVHMISSLPQSKQPSSVVLEAPFSSLAEAIREHPLAKLFIRHPFFDTFFVEPLVVPETNFDSASLVKEIKSPLLILHAMDDGIIPYSQGTKLFGVAMKSRGANVPAPKMISFDASRGYGHKAIFKDPELAKYVSEFIKSSTTLQKTKSSEKVTK